MSVHGVPTLYVVATPIGNLQDISLRALEVLKSVDSIAAEDTRHTSHLLSHFAIQKKLIAVHEHNEQKSAQLLLERIQAGESIALVSDAGTPGISDPGAIVVDLLRKAGVNVVPIPEQVLLLRRFPRLVLLKMVSYSMDSCLRVGRNVEKLWNS